MSTWGALGRREFLALAGVLGLGCPGKERGVSQTPSPPAAPVGPQGWDRWIAAQQAVRQSPDHLVARAKRLVEAKDAQAIFAFVRDEIAVLPGARTASGMSYREARWGTRGTLRGGMGTVREKAQLLRDLLRQAGHEAKTMLHDGDSPTDEQVEAMILRPPRRRLALPPIEGTPPLPEENVVFDTPTPEMRALAERIAAPLPEDAKESAPQEAWSWESSATPVVELQQDGKPVYLDLFRPEGGFGIEPKRITQEMRELVVPKITVELQMVRAGAPTTPISLVKQTLHADQLAGRQLMVQTQPAVDPATLKQAGLDDLNLFIPVLQVQALDGDTEGLEPALGDPFTVGGSVLSVDDEGTVRIDGEPYADGKSDAARRVTSLEVVATDSSRFDDVALRVVARDASGEVVEGLTAGDFVIADEDRRRPHVLRDNHVAPHITFLSDSSLSMPTTYRGAEGEAFFDELRKRIQALVPGAQIESSSTSSNIWTHTAEAALKQPNLVIYATDGHVNDKPTPAIRRALASGPPVLIMDVTSRHAARLEEIAEAAGGERIPIADPAAFEEAVLKAAKSAEPGGYAMTYLAPAEGPPKRTVRVALAERPEVAATTTYDVPPKAERLVADSIVGLYLIIKQGRHTVHHRIAGLSYVDRAPLEVQREAIRACRRALVGSTILSFEAGMPSATQLTDDFITAALTRRPLSKALENEDDDALREYFATGGQSLLPQELVALQAPLSAAWGDGVVVVPHQLRLVIFGMEVDAEGKVQSRIDIPGFGVWTGHARDGRRAFDHTLLATTEIALREGAFPQSTVQAIGDASLKRLSWRGTESQVETGDYITDALRKRELYERRGHHLLGADGVGAFFQVDKRTGALVALLPDGRGGAGGPSVHDRLALNVAILNVLIHLASMAGLMGGGFAAGVAGVSLGIVAAYGQRLAKLYAAVATAINNMDASQLPAQAREMVLRSACDVVTTMATGLIGLAAALVGLFGALGYNVCDVPAEK